MTLVQRLGQFSRDYCKLVNALQIHNLDRKLFMMSILPIGPDPNLHKFVSIKSQQIKEFFGQKPGIIYVNLYVALNIQGEIPPEFLRGFHLNRTGIKRFFNVFSKALVHSFLWSLESFGIHVKTDVPGNLASNTISICILR